MSLPTSRRPQKTPVTRNPDESRQRILDAAMNEFSAKGYAGARIDKIAERAKLNPRMIYHYFGGKQPLYIAVLETGLKELREAEHKFSSDEESALDALLHLYEFIHDHFASHPKLINLLSTENLNKASFLKRSSLVPTISSPTIDLIERLLKRGVASGTVRKGIDPLQLYVSMVALSYFHLSNGHTLSVIFQKDLLGSAWLKPRAAHTAEILRSYLAPN